MTTKVGVIRFTVPNQTRMQIMGTICRFDTRTEMQILR
jgi:hypothetical protein